MFRRTKTEKSKVVSDASSTDAVGPPGGMEQAKPPRRNNNNNNNNNNGTNKKGTKAMESISVRSDDETIIAATNPAAKPKTQTEKSLEAKITKLQDSLKQTKNQAHQEKHAKRKLYSSLVKLATELKRMRAQQEEQKSAEQRPWYQGGMWRKPATLHPTARRPLSLTDLFFQLVVVVALVRMDESIAQLNYVTFDSCIFFGIIYMIWNKEASYSTRFDATDLSYKLVKLLTCFSLLFGTLSSSASLTSDGGTRMMMVASSVTVLYWLLYVRVAIVFHNQADAGDIESYAWFNIVMLTMEAITWGLGIFYFSETFEYRYVLFLIGLVLSIRLPRAVLANDFYAASTKRSVLYILLLGFLLQDIVQEASPLFDFQTPTLQQYTFLGACCLLLFCVKLLFVDDSNTLHPNDHAMLVNRFASVCFEVGYFGLLLSTVIFGAGLSLLSHSYLTAAAALPFTSKQLVCQSFAMTILCMAFLKSMHLRRIPEDAEDRRLFLAAYLAQAVSMLGIVGLGLGMGASAAHEQANLLSILTQDEFTLLLVLTGMAVLLVLVSWLDEAVELNLYQNEDASRASMIHPFGLWWCLHPEEEGGDDAAAKEETKDDDDIVSPDSRLRELSPLLGASVINMRMDSASFNYGSTTSLTSAATAAVEEEMDGVADV